MMENRWLWGYEGEARGRGESEGGICCLTRRFCPSILVDIDVIKYQFHDMVKRSGFRAYDLFEAKNIYNY
jgi:hypothetical protein